MSTYKPNKIKLSRRTALQGASAFALAGISNITTFSSSAQPRTRMKVTLPWLPDASYAHVYVAKNQGFWSKRGIDVEISRGSGALTAAQAVHSGQFDVGIVPIAATILLAARGIELVSIGQVDYNATMGVAMLADSPIKSPKDLEGKSLGQTMTSSDAQFFPVFCELTKVDRSKINALSLEANVRTRTMWERKVDAITGFFSSIYPASEAAGIKTRYFLYSNFGINMYADAVTVKPELLRDNPRVAEAFVEGMYEGAMFHLTRPEEALKIFLQEVKEMQMSATAEDFARIGIATYIYCVLSEPAVLQRGYGAMDDGKLDKMIDLIMKYQAPADAKRPAREKLFRTDFVGRHKPTQEQWKAAQDYSKGIAAVTG